MIEVVHNTLVAGSAGLTSAEARARLASDRPNELRQPGSVHPPACWPTNSFTSSPSCCGSPAGSQCSRVEGGNAFACRSTTRSPGVLGWTSNGLLVPAIGLGLLFAFAALLVDPVARELEHAVPPVAGWLVALASPIVLLCVDAGDKRRRSSSQSRVRGANDGPSPLLDTSRRGGSSNCEIATPVVVTAANVLTEEDRNDQRHD